MLSSLNRKRSTGSRPTSPRGSFKARTTGVSVSALSAGGFNASSDGRQRFTMPRPNYSDDVTAEKQSASFYYSQAHLTFPHRLTPKYHPDRTCYVAWLGAVRQRSDMKVSGDDCRTCLLEGCQMVCKSQEEMLAHSYDCPFFDLSARYLCPCGTPINLKCDRKERLVNILWRFLSTVGRLRPTRHSISAPSGSLNRPSFIGSRVFPDSPSDYQHVMELHAPCCTPFSEPPSNYAELKGTPMWYSSEVEAPAGISELPDHFPHPGNLVSCEAGRCHGYCFSMNQSILMDIQETDPATDYVRTRDSITLVSANNTHQQLSGSPPPSYSPTHANPFFSSQDQSTTVDDMDFASSQSSWTSSNVSSRKGRSFDSDSSYPPETSPFLSTQIASEGFHEDPNETQSLEDLLRDNTFGPTHVTGVDGMSECEGSFEQGTQANSEESLNAPNEDPCKLMLQQMLRKPYTQEEIDAFINMDGYVPDHCPLGLIDDKNCRPEHGHSCLTCRISRSLSKFLKSSIQFTDVFVAAYILVLKDIQSKLPGIDAAKSLSKLVLMFTNPAVCFERGLNVFRGIQKDGKKGETIEDVFAFLTIVYASALTLHNDSNLTTLNPEMLFQEALCWLAGVGELHEQERNVNVIKNIWQPRCGGDNVPTTVEASRSPSSLSMMENNCVRIVQEILDDLDPLLFPDGHSRTGSFASSSAGNASFVNMAEVHEEWLEKADSYVESIERLRGMASEVSWSDIETAITIDFFNQSPSLGDSSPDGHMDIDSEPWSPLTTQWPNTFQSPYLSLTINPFASSRSHSSSPNSPDSPTSPTSQRPPTRCPFCNHIPTGNWSKGNLKRHINEKHAIKDESLRCGFEGCATTFTRPENRKTHLRDIHGQGPAKTPRRKSVRDGAQSRKSSNASTESQSSAEW